MRIEKKTCLIFNEQNSDKQCFGLAFRAFVAGICAGIIEIFTTQPLDVIKTRLQFQSKKQPDSCLIYYKNMFDCIQKIHRYEGFKGFYKGLLAELFSNPLRLALRFSLFEHYNTYLFPENNVPSPAVYGLAGVFTGVSESLVLTPFELIKVKMQTNILKYPPGFFDVVQNVIKNDGFGLYGLYRGFDCTIARNTLFGGIYFGVYHTLKNRISQLENKQIESSLHFVCGFVAAVCAALLNTPFDVVKSKVQGRKKPQYNYLIPTFLYVYRRDGFRGLYQGLLPRILLVGVENGVIMVVYEAILNGLKADYTLDDSFWNDETPAGEVERLLREYRQNQELVRNIGAHLYQIIYPVQLRHHEKMGISTREAPKVRIARSTSFPQRGYGDGGNYQSGSATRGRSRQTGKHFHRTSLLIKAFNHKFRLDLELNTQLLAPNLMQKHFLPSGAEHVSKQEIEHCYYHGTVKDYPGASAAFHTCNGVSGVIHVGNETFVIHPFYGGDLSKHPHVIFEARTKANKGCANSGNMEWRTKHFRRQKLLSGMTDENTGNSNSNTNTDGETNTSKRSRRDVRDATKYIETALVIDKGMFDKRNGSTRAEVVHDAIQVANIADLYFRTLNTRVSVVYIETWQGSNQAPIEKSQDISRALLNFNDYTSRKLFKVDKDTTQLLTGETFQGGESGMAVPETVCTGKSVGISVDINTYEPHLLAGTMAHMIGHNIGMGHDDGREECFCRDWHGCIMAQSIVGLENVQPYKFSECSKSDYIDTLRIGRGICLLNKPNELEVRRTCGNGIVEEGEDCDCGTIEECHAMDPCCDPITCKLTKESDCASGPCCKNCRLRPRGVVCRESRNECDLPEHCTGEHGQCPVDTHKKNGNPCGDNTGYCFNGTCPTVKIQCEQIWGYGTISADEQCFEQFNSKGSINGHCGTDTTGHFIKCESENIKCGSLQCQMGYKYPVISGMEQAYSRTIISIKGKEYECKSAGGSSTNTDIPRLGLVRDGTPCGENLVCINQTCTSIFPYIDQGKCPSNHNNMECSGHGVCTNINKCYCDSGWGGPDCSLVVEVTTPLPSQTEISATLSSAERAKSEIESKMEKKETPYGEGKNTNLSTLTLVLFLVGCVKFVFLCFATTAVCYRRSTVPKYDPPYVKKPMQKAYAATSNHTQDDNVSMDSVNKMLSFGNAPYSRGDSQRVLFRPVNHMAPGPSRFQEHKMQSMPRGSTGSGGEDDPSHSGEEETVSFIDLPPNNLSCKAPEKGILKKHAGYDGIGGKQYTIWLDRDMKQPNNTIQLLDNNELGDGSSVAIAEVQRQLKSLNGYHENLLDALRTARGAASTPSGNIIISEEMLCKKIADCAAGYSRSSRVSSQEKVCESGPQLHTVMVEGSPRHHHHHHQHADDEEDDEVPPCGPIRIRNLEDLMRQLEHHGVRHMSPSGSEDIRMSETEADRHYRLESSTVCSDSSQGRCRSRGEDESRFVYGRYRQPQGSGGSRHGPYPAPSHHHSHHGMSHTHSHHHMHHTDDEGIYESADHDRGGNMDQTPDSESDEFIQAQQQLARWASEETLPGGGPGITSTVNVSNREYFPSPVSSSSDNSSGGGASVARAPPKPTIPIHQTASSHVQQLPQLVPQSQDSDNDSSKDTAASSSVSGAEQSGPTSSTFPKRYPEYKH